MTSFIIGLVIGFGCGSVAMWVSKSWIENRVLDANVLSAKLHARADELIK